MQDIKEIIDNYPSFFVNVNMSYSQLERPEFVQEVINIINENDFPANNLQLELTERCRNLDIKYLKEQLAFLREHDIKIALDDYGTGNSTINMLCELPFTGVKIDQTFILNILNKGKLASKNNDAAKSVDMMPRIFIITQRVMQTPVPPAEYIRSLSFSLQAGQQYAVLP